MKFCKTKDEAYRLAAESGGDVWHDGFEEFAVATDEELAEEFSWEGNNKVWVRLSDRRRYPRVPFRELVEVERIEVH